MQQGAGTPPFAVQRSPRRALKFCDLVQAQTGEVAQFDQTQQARIDLAQLAQGQIDFGRLRIGDGVTGIVAELGMLEPPAALVGVHPAEQCGIEYECGIMLGRQQRVA